MGLESFDIFGFSLCTFSSSILYLNRSYVKLKLGQEKDFEEINIKYNVSSSECNQSSLDANEYKIFEHF